MNIEYVMLHAERKTKKGFDKNNPLVKTSYIDIYAIDLHYYMLA